MFFLSPEALGIWNPMLSGMQAWNGTLGKTVFALNSEWLNFLNQRMKDDFALSQQMASCRSGEEAWRAYVEFWQKAVADYRHEFTELARLGDIMAGESVSAMQQGAATDAKDLTTRAPRH